jgi:hypothetical protein
MKWLIVTGNDFGISRGINRGIIEAHRAGILTSASLLVNAPASEDGEGMFRFTSLHDAVEALEGINTHYERHCRSARVIAERTSTRSKYWRQRSMPPWQILSRRPRQRPSRDRTLAG